MTAKEAAAALAVSDDTIRRWAADGRLQVVTTPRIPGGKPTYRFATALIRQMVEGAPADMEPP